MVVVNERVRAWADLNGWFNGPRLYLALFGCTFGCGDVFAVLGMDPAIRRVFAFLFHQRVWC